MDDGAQPPIEYHPSKAGDVYQVGTILKMDANAVTQADVDEAGDQLYFCAGELTGEADKLVPVYRIRRSQVYCAPWTVAATSIVPGDKVTLSADRRGLTATKAKGLAEVIRMDGKAIGDVAYVRF